MVIALGKLIQTYMSPYQGLEKKVWYGILLSFAEAVYVGIYYFLPLYFINNLHFRISTASLLISIFGLGTIAGGYYGGKWSDRWRPQVVIKCSLLLQAFVFLNLIYLQSYLFLSMNLALMGFCSYAFITSSYVYVLELCHNDQHLKSKALSILAVASNLGLAISAIMIGYFSALGFHFIFIFSSFSLLALFIFGHVGLQENQVAINGGPKPEATQEEKVTLKELPDQNLIYILLISTFCMGFIIFQLSSTYPIYLQSSYPNGGMFSVSLLFTINSLMVVFMQAQFCSYFSKYNTVFIAGVGTLLLGGGMTVLVFTQSFIFAIASCIIYTLGEMLFFTNSQLILYNNSTSSKKGSIMGLFRTIYASSRIAAPSLGGYIFQYLGSSALWAFCGILGTIFFICFYFFKNVPDNGT